MNLIIKNLDIARGAALSGWRLTVATAWFTIAIAIIFMLTDKISFSYHSSSGIVGWCAMNKYPKQQETFWFLSIIAGIPGIMFLGWSFWMLITVIIERITGIGLLLILRTTAVCHLPFLATWIFLVQLRTDLLEILLIETAVAAGMSIAAIVISFVISQKFRCRQVGAFATPQNSAGTAENTSSNNLAVRPRWIWMIRTASYILYLIILLAVIPTMIYMLRSDENSEEYVDLFHEGEFLVPMNEFLHGAVPYRDIYIQHGLFHNVIIPWLGAKLIDPSLHGVRTIRKYIEPTGFVAFYLLVISVCRNRFLAALFLLYICCSSIPPVPARMVFGFTSLAVMASFVGPPCGFRILCAGRPCLDKRPSLAGIMRICLKEGWYLMLSGFLGMLAVWHSLEIGLFTLAAGTMFLSAVSIFQTRISLWRRTLPLLLFLFGASIAFVIPGIYFLINGAMDDLIRNFWIQSSYQMETWGLNFPNLNEFLSPILLGTSDIKWPAYLYEGNAKWYYAPFGLALSWAFLAYCAMESGFWKSRTAAVLLLITLAGTFYFRGVLGRSDSAHIYYGFVFALLLLIFLSERLLSAAWDLLFKRESSILHRTTGIFWFLPALLSASCLLWFCNTAYKPLPAFKEKYAKLSSSLYSKDSNKLLFNIPRGGNSSIPKDQTIEINRVCDYIKDNSYTQESIFDFSNQAGYLYFAQRRSATRYFQISYASHPRMQEEVVRDLKRLQVRLVIYRNASSSHGIDGVPQEKRHPIIAKYICDKYAYDRTVGAVEFWKRRQ